MPGLVYRHAPRPNASAIHGLHLRPPPGSRPRRGDRDPPVSPHAAGRSARRSRRRAGLRQHRLRVPRAGRLPVRDPRRGRGLRRDRPPPRRRHERAHAGRHRVARPRWRSRAGRGLDRRHSPDYWPGFLVGPAAAALGFVAARSLFGRVRARLDAEAAGALPLYAEGIACSPQGSRSSSRRWPSWSSRRSRGCSSGVAAVRARSTRGCGSCGEGRSLALRARFAGAIAQRAILGTRSSFSRSSTR